jgi:ribonuclease R
VAVLERGGRFLTAEPLFPPAPGDGDRPRSRSAITVRPERSGPRAARVGDLVLVAPPARAQPARVIRSLGRPDVARDLLDGLMLDRGLARRFPADVERDAKQAAERVLADPGPRTDLRELPTFTIDPASARDFDDAVSAQALEDGAARVWVHIADVAAHMREGSPLDREARLRATSVYVPGAVEPMLPHALSSEACSLRPGVDRAAVTAELEFEGDRVRRSVFYRSLIRSDARLDYEQVDRIFDGREQAAEPWAEPLRVARRVARALAERRERAGALVIDSVEPEFEFDPDGHITAIRGRAQTESHRLIEHLMIAANEAVAELLAARSVPCLYRVHERPDPERVLRLVEQLASLKVPTPPVPDPLSSTQAADLLGAISVAVERHAERTGSGRIALGALVLRSLKQAYYSPQNMGHAGLHSRRYCHFTSPIRRYPDVVCHRALLSAVGGGEHAHRASELIELGAWTSERERGAMLIERDADDVARCFVLERLLFEEGPDRTFDGEVTGLISAGAFVSFGTGEGGAQAFEGMLPVRRLRAPAPARTRSGRREDRDGGRGRAQGRERGGAGEGREWWELNEQGTVLRGERSGAAIALGEPIEVRVARVDTVRGRVDLLPAG